MTDPRLERWLDLALATPGLTAIEDRDEAWAMLLDDALRGVEVVRPFEGPIVDVGSGNGSPGVVLAASLPDREVTLLDSSRRKAAFLERVAVDFPNVAVVYGRAEEQETDRFGVVVAKALAPPAVALEWVLPLVREGGAAVLWLGSSVDLDALSRVSEQLGGSELEERNGLAVARKIGPTPAGFPRRPGMARKRPLSSSQ
ncbi:MAG TPA: RsmG family class I SAM-dependent methyltransferase [Gaiellaceae bacterium]|nr:RsmG family class I SAM-dependent methyltransferase [Gaiellaceae bacterium]